MAMFKNLSGISSREREFKIPLRECFNEAMLWGRQKKASKVRFDEDTPLSGFWLESGSQRCNFLVRGNRSDITEAPESHKYERACLESRSHFLGVPEQQSKERKSKDLRGRCCITRLCTVLELFLQSNFPFYSQYS